MQEIKQTYNENQSTQTFLDNPTELLLEDYSMNFVPKEYSLSDIVDDKGIESCLSISSNSESFRRSISQNDSQTYSNFTGINKNKSHTKLIIVG